MDFSTVNHIDATSIQTLLDTRQQLDRYTAPDTVDWHFANITSRWTKRGLVAAGFGLRGKLHDDDGTHPTIFSIAELTDGNEVRKPTQLGDEETQLPKPNASSDDGISHETGESPELAPGREISRTKKEVVLQGLNRPLFHFDLQEAVEAAVADAKTKTY